MVRDYQPSDLERILKIWLQSNLQAHDFIDRSYWEKNYDCPVAYLLCVKLADGHFLADRVYPVVKVFLDFFLLFPE